MGLANRAARIEKLLALSASSDTGDLLRRWGSPVLFYVLLPLYPNYGDYVHDTVHSRNLIEMEEGYA